MARSKVFYGDVYSDDSRPFYVYPGKAPPKTEPWTPTLLQIRGMLSFLHILLPTACPLLQINTQVVVNSYTEPTDKIGHSDKIQSFALGSAVKYKWRKRY